MKFLIGFILALFVISVTNANHLGPPIVGDKRVENVLVCKIYEDKDNVKALVRSADYLSKNCILVFNFKYTIKSVVKDRTDRGIDFYIVISIDNRIIIVY